MIYYIHFSLIKLWHLILTAENILIHIQKQLTFLITNEVKKIKHVLYVSP